VISNGYNRRTNEIGSELRLFLDTATVETLPGALWWCVVEMTLYGTEKPVIIESKKAPFTLANGKKYNAFSFYDEFGLLDD